MKYYWGNVLLVVCSSKVVHKTVILTVAVSWLALGKFSRLAEVGERTHHCL